jgi:TPR repeat protein
VQAVWHNSAAAERAIGIAAVDEGHVMKHYRWRLAAAALLIAAAANLAVAGPLEDGVSAYHAQDYAKALELWRPLAEKGNADAQYRLGTLYAEGKGVPQSDATAAEWFQRAADQGNAMAQYNLGVSYGEGLGVTKDDKKAAAWFRRAAEQGMPYAQLNLGILYAEKRGVEPDDVEAVKWLELAIFALPAGGARSDAARVLQQVADRLTDEQLIDARSRERDWKPKPEAKK